MESIQRVLWVLFLLVSEVSKVLALPDLNQKVSIEDILPTFGELGSAHTDYEMAIVTTRSLRQRRTEPLQKNEFQFEMEVTITTETGKLDIHLRPESGLASPTFTVVTLDDNGETLSPVKPPSCLYQGVVKSDKKFGVAALSSCGDDMSGVIWTSQGAQILQPLPNDLRHRRGTTSPPTHILYRAKRTEFCGVDDMMMATSRKRRQENISKSSTISNKTIETAVFVDDVMYNRMASAHDDPEEAILNQVFAMMNAVQLVYSHPSLEVRFQIVLVKLLIIKSATAGPAKEDGDINEYLKKFCQWQKIKNPGDDLSDANHWDHALMLSGLDLYMKEKDNRVVIGLAWVSGMCNPRYSCSLNEGMTMESVFVISHELGHNLGMQHDGEGNNCSEVDYLMSASLGPGKTSWSSCSNNYLHNFLESSSANCLEDSADPPQDLNRKMGTLPGERYPAEEQCYLAFGNEFKPHITIETPFDDICRELWCANGTLAQRAHPALHGTKCGSQKVCYHGSCILWDSIMGEKGNPPSEDEEPRSKHPEEGRPQGLGDILANVFKTIKDKVLSLLPSFSNW